MWLTQFNYIYSWITIMYFACEVFKEQTPSIK